MKQARTPIPTSRWRGSAPPGGSPARAWVHRTCAEQGLAAQVTDPDTVAAVATLIGAPLDAPNGIEASRVEAVQSAHGTADSDVSEDGGNDRVLPRHRQGGPRGTKRSRPLHEFVKG
jgi:hypothetical protein